MTLTKTKRDRFPLRFAKKDARTKIYRAIYGIPVRPDPKGMPSLNETRRLAGNWNYSDAKLVLEENRLTACLPHTTLAELERRLDMLKHYKA